MKPPQQHQHQSQPVGQPPATIGHHPQPAQDDTQGRPAWSFPVPQQQQPTKPAILAPISVPATTPPASSTTPPPASPSTTATNYQTTFRTTVTSSSGSSVPSSSSSGSNRGQSPTRPTDFDVVSPDQTRPPVNQLRPSATSEAPMMPTTSGSSDAPGVSDLVVAPLGSITALKPPVSQDKQQPTTDSSMNGFDANQIDLKLTKDYRSSGSVQYESDQMRQLQLDRQQQQGSQQTKQSNSALVARNPSSTWLLLVSAAMLSSVLFCLRQQRIRLIASA